MVWTTACLLVALTAAGEGSAQGDLTVAVLPPLVHGTLDGAWRNLLDQHLMDGVRRAAANPRRTQAGDSDAADCREAACVRRYAARTGAGYVVGARIRVREKNYAFALALYDGRLGTAIATGSGSCEVCGAAEAGELLGRRVTLLLDHLRDQRKGEADVVVSSDPQGARIVVDGRPVGQTPVTLTLASGERRLVLDRDGYWSAERALTVRPGLREMVNVRLESRARPAPRWSPIALGVGAALVAAGVALLWLDDRPYRARCGGNDVDRDGDCRHLYDTFTGGLALTVAGATAAAAGGWGLMVGVAPPAGESERRITLATGRRF